MHASWEAETEAANPSHPKLQTWAPLEPRTAPKAQQHVQRVVPEL